MLRMDGDDKGEPWAGTGGLSEHRFLYFMLAIFISYVILLISFGGEVLDRLSEPESSRKGSYPLPGRQ